MIAFLILDRVADAPGSVWLEMLSSIVGYTAWILFILIPVLFPSGRPSDRFTRALFITLILVLIGVIGAELISPDPKELTGMTSPLAVSGLAWFARFMLNEGFMIVPVLLVASLGSLVPRWRRAEGVERLQYSWFLAGLGIAIIGLVVTQLLPDDGSFLAFSIVFTFCLLLIPASIAVAVLRYRLYEIDRLLSRSVTYGLVIAILGLIYALGAVWLPTQLLGDQPELFVAGSTLLSAALFNPLRRRIQRVADRRFNRSHYRAEMVVNDFVRDLRNRLDSSEVTSLMTDVVADTLQPATLGLWLRDSQRRRD